MRLLSVSALLAAALSLTGCVLTHPVDISGPLEAPVMSVRDTGMFNAVGACAYAFTVSDAESDAVLWAAETDPAACIGEGSVTYGAPPSGFRVTTPARPLQTGVIYRVSALSTSEVPAHVLAAHVDGRWRVVR